MHLNAVTIAFLEGEIANEAEGGETPSTVASAIDSFVQAPDVFADAANLATLAVDLLTLSVGNQAEPLADLLA